MDPRSRFSNRVDAYVAYRPGYPTEAVDAVCRALPAGAEEGPVAEVGSGTGIFVRLLLDRDLAVYAVEPNARMRSAAETQLCGRQGFHSLAGDAKSTGLPDGSVAMVICAQAFHWFANPDVVAEFNRILVPGGTIVLVWNYRLTDCDPFHLGYERLVSTYGIDYGKVNHRNVTAETIEALFAPRTMEISRFENIQVLDWDGIRGRLESSSYVPAPSSREHGELMAQMRKLFDSAAEDGRAALRYETIVYTLGPLPAAPR